MIKIGTYEIVILGILFVVITVSDHWYGLQDSCPFVCSKLDQVKKLGSTRFMWTLLYFL